MKNRRQKTAAVSSSAPLLVEPHSTLKYPHRLSFYESPPGDNVTLEEFELWAVDRLRVLAEIEASAIRDLTLDSVATIVATQCEKYLPLDSGDDLAIKSMGPASAEYTLDAQRRKDRVSHYILRLAFCRSEELRAKFIKAETTLFKCRYRATPQSERAAFLASRSIGGDRVSEEDKKQYMSQLMAATPSLKSEADFQAETFYRVNWTKVPDLVSTRRVFIRAGYAYVPSSLQSSIIFQAFSTRLATALELTSRAIPALDEDDRLLPIITHFSQGFLAGVSGEIPGGMEAGYEGGLTKEMVDSVAKKHFPACMRNLHTRFRQDQHLKHWGRLQYGLFLKVMGLPIDEAIQFWRQGFGNTMTDDKFTKEYRYNIRHSYGLEGKRLNYPARSCSAIIRDNRPGPGDAHGCPFRDFPADKLRSALTDMYGIPYSSHDMEEILSASASQHYHVACTRVFEVTHNGQGLADGDSVMHPNQYAARSRELEKEKEDAMMANVQNPDYVGPSITAEPMAVDEPTKAAA